MTVPIVPGMNTFHIGDSELMEPKICGDFEAEEGMDRVEDVESVGDVEIAEEMASVPYVLPLDV